MAMSGAVLAAAIKTKVIEKNPELADQLGTNIDMDYLFEAIAEAVVEHITSLAQVTVAVASVSGVTTGASVSGPGTGTGTIS